MILDADALNIIAEAKIDLTKIATPTILTPHLGEFQRLFPHIVHQDRLSAVMEASQHSGSIVLLKGARTTVSSPDGNVWVVRDSTPALARGGSGDVLTGLMGGLVAQESNHPLGSVAATAAWWHAQAGMALVKMRGELGVDAFTLAHSLSGIF